MSIPQTIEKCHYQNGHFVETGDDLTYLKEVFCEHCKQSLYRKEYKSIVQKIVFYPGTGFCEIGDTVEITLNDGHILKGDTENGF
jgi:hypothetical protein